MINNSFRRLAELSVLMPLILLVSCKNELEPSVMDEAADGTKVSVQMIASLEQAGDVKTSISDEKDESGIRHISWNAGDEIKAFWSPEGFCTAKAEKEGESTNFTLEIPRETKRIWAVYPSSTNTSFSDGKLNLEIPAQQNGSFADHNISVAEAEISSGNMHFYNVSSCLRLTVTDPQITKAVVRGNNSEPVCGRIAVDIDSDAVVLGAATETSDVIEVALGDRSVYYISILPGVTFGNGVSVELFKGDKSVGCVSSEAFSLTRAQIANLGSLDWLTNRYVSPEGSGKKDGTSWDNAWSVAELKDFLTAADGRTDEERMKFNDLSFRLAEGTYVFAESDIINVEYSAPISFTLYGGFAAEGGSERSGKTIFSGQNSHGILAVKNNAHINFDGISFSNGKGNGGGQAAVRIEGEKADVSFNNCVFSDNSNTATSAAVQVSGLANATFTACEFSNNATTMAAALNVDNATSCLVDACSFVGNSAGTYHGGAVQIKGSCQLKDCTFDSNSAKECGGAVILNLTQTAKTVSLTGCTFLKNSSKKGGAIYAYGSGSEAVFSNCNFGDGTEANANTASGNGAAAYAEDGVRFTFTGCNANGNKAACGAFLGMTGASNVTVDGGSFRDNTATISGGAIQVDSDGTKRAALVVKNAEFAGNRANNGGGAIRLIKENETSAAGYTDITIETCTFSQNSSSNGYGGALDLRNSGTSIVRDCTFDGNSTDIAASYGKGGAINCCAGNVAGGTIEISSCIFKGNGTKGGTEYGLDKGGAVNVGGNGNANNSSFVAYINDCVFQDNHSTQGGAINVAKGTMYMNASSFTGNYITFRYGTTLLADAGTKLRMNNISIANNSYSTTADQKHQAAWFNIGTADILLSNATLIGENQSKTAFTGGNPMLIRFDGLTSGTANFINDIIAFPDQVRVPIQATANFNINVIDCKTGDFNASDLTVLSGTSSKDFVGNSDYFAGLQAEYPSESGKQFYWSWNGNILKGTNTAKATLEAVNTAIQTADADFYSWLQSVGGDVNDALGNARGTETWPGAYQKN